LLELKAHLSSSDKSKLCNWLSNTLQEDLKGIRLKTEHRKKKSSDIISVQKKLSILEIKQTASALPQMLKT
jgi:hypothetical protein